MVPIATLAALSFAAAGPLQRSAVRSKRATVPPAMIGAFLDKLYKSLKQDVDYDALAREEKSFAGEAAEYALAGAVPTTSKAGYEVATFAGGCFWGTELHFQRLPGVLSTCVGYTQGDVERPTYGEVCTGGTKHTEGIQLCFDPAVCSYEALCQKLLSTVDSTALNRVGNDRGTQYRHGLYPHSDAQAAVARRCLDAEQVKVGRPVVTELRRAAVFCPAEAYHHAPRSLPVPLPLSRRDWQAYSLQFSRVCPSISVAGAERYLEKGGQSAAKDATERVRCYG